MLAQLRGVLVQQRVQSCASSGMNRRVVDPMTLLRKGVGRQADALGLLRRVALLPIDVAGLEPGGDFIRRFRASAAFQVLLQALLQLVERADHECRAVLHGFAPDLQRVRQIDDVDVVTLFGEKVRRASARTRAGSKAFGPTRARSPALVPWLAVHCAVL